MTAEVDYVIVDLETTGLDPQKDIILEVGILLLNRNLDELDEFSSVIGFTDYIEHDFVRNMHTKSGLLDECREAYSFSQKGLDNTTASVMQGAVVFLDKYYDRSLGKLPLTGSTINFDRGFLNEHMPVLHDWFDYHNYDVSTLRGLSKKYKLPQPEDSEKEHRALADCYDTARQLRFYLRQLGLVK